MTPATLDAYLRQLERELRRRFVRDITILEEAREHLADAVAREQQRGHSLPDAEQVAIERFGRADVVAAAYAADRSRTLHRVLLVGAIASGFAIAYVDSRPTWDDTGITAGALMLTAGLLALLGPRRPWAWALLAGIWIPAYAIVRSPSPSTLTMLFVLVFPLAGAYVGWALRRWGAPVES